MLGSVVLLGEGEEGKQFYIYIYKDIITYLFIFILATTKKDSLLKGEELS
jgi:hypothetical protein